MIIFFAWFYPVAILFFWKDFNTIAIETKLIIVILYSLFLACFGIYNQLYKLVKEIEKRK